MTKHTGHKAGGQSHPGHKKVFDVVRPGKVMAPPNSRSVIVGHKPPVADDQFVSTGSATPAEPKTPATAPLMVGDPGERRSLLSHAAPGIAPLTTPLATSAIETRSPAATHQVGAETASAETSKPPQPASSTSAPADVLLPAGPTFDPGLAEVARDLGGSPSATETGPSTTTATPSVQPAAPTPTMVAPNPAPAEASLQSTDNAAHLAVGHTVTDPLEDLGYTNQNTPGGSAPAQVPAHDTRPTTHDPLASSKYSPKTIDQLLAETGAPDLTLDNPPPQKTLISHHQPHRSSWGWVVTIIILLVLAAAVVDILLDGGIWTPSIHIPHTHFF